MCARHLSRPKLSDPLKYLLPIWVIRFATQGFFKPMSGISVVAEVHQAKRDIVRRLRIHGFHLGCLLERLPRLFPVLQIKISRTELEVQGAVFSVSQPNGVSCSDHRLGVTPEGVEAF